MVRVDQLYEIESLGSTLCDSEYSVYCDWQKDSSQLLTIREKCILLREVVMRIINAIILLFLFIAGNLMLSSAQYIGDNRPWGAEQIGDSLAARVDTTSFKVVTSKLDSLVGAR